MSDYKQTSQYLSNKIDVVINQIGKIRRDGLEITAGCLSTGLFE